MADISDEPRADVGELPSSDSHAVLVQSGATWSAVKVFTAPLVAGTNDIGEQVTDWIRSRPGVIVEIVIAQSGACETGCISLAVFYRPHARA